MLCSHILARTFSFTFCCVCFDLNVFWVTHSPSSPIHTQTHIHTHILMHSLSHTHTPACSLSGWIVGPQLHLTLSRQTCRSPALSLRFISLSLTMRHICCGLVNSNSSAAAAAAPVVVVVFCWLSLVRLDCSLIIYTRLCLAHFILGIFA